MFYPLLNITVFRMLHLFFFLGGGVIDTYRFEETPLLPTWRHHSKFSHISTTSKYSSIFKRYFFVSCDIASWNLVRKYQLYEIKPTTNIFEFYSEAGGKKIPPKPCCLCHITRCNIREVLSTGWTVRGSNPGGGEIFRTCPDRPWGTPSLLYKGYGVFRGGG